MFMEAPFCEGSLVIVSARSQSTLEHLGIDGDVCIEMPELGEADAMSLFLYHAAQGKEFVEEKDKQDIKWCINRCYFCKGDNQGSHYHPLALKALGLHLGYHWKTPSEWVVNLSRVRNFNFFSEENDVFDILRSSFDLLPPTEQILFMDVVTFKPKNAGDFKEWLCLVYKEDEDEIQRRLHRLKGKGLLQDVDLESGRISMHDLYREFAELEAKGKLLESRDMEKRRWVYVDNGDVMELESTPGGGCWHKLIRLYIYEAFDSPPGNQIDSLEGIEWHYFSNVVVLKLDGLKGVEEALNFQRLKCLRSLDLQDVNHLDRLEGLERLRNLTYFRWSNPHRTNAYIVGQFPSSLKILRIGVDGCLLGPDVLARCNNLCKLELRQVKVGKVLDLSNCSSLHSVTLENVRELETLSGFTARWAPRLQSLEVCKCYELVDIPELDHLIGLGRLELGDCGFKELPDLQDLTKLQVLRLFCSFSELRFKVPGLRIPRQLRELYYNSWAKAPNLDGFEQLQVLNLFRSKKLTCMEGVGDLPALRCLHLHHCSRLVRLPDLSKSRNLEEIDLRDCLILDLHEQDIRMLATLPLLQPVPVGFPRSNALRLDFVRRKVLRHSLKGPRAPSSWLAWKEDEWKENDLGVPPISIGPCGIWN